MTGHSKIIASQDAMQALFHTLEKRFNANLHRHQGIRWEQVAAKLHEAPGKVRTLLAMEESGGAPDVTGFEESTGSYLFMDCALESPSGRRSICYDHEAQTSRKKFPPKANAVDMAREMGIEILTEAEYRQLQTLGPFDTKTSSWLKTPATVRQLGGALFGDFRYGRVFIYHNGAPSYYAARGFRGVLRV